MTSKTAKATPGGVKQTKHFSTPMQQQTGEFREPQKRARVGASIQHNSAADALISRHPKLAASAIEGMFSNNKIGGKVASKAAFPDSNK